MLKLLGADENFRQSFGMPLGDHFYIPWLAKEVWMDQVLEDARRLLQQVVDSTHGVHKNEMNVATPPSKHVDLKNSFRRLVYSMYTSTIFKENNDSGGVFLLTDWEQDGGRVQSSQRIKEDQERQEQGKNRGGRPPSSKGGISINDTRKLGSSHTQKNVGKGALIHGPLARVHCKKLQGWFCGDARVVGLGEREKIRNGKPSAWSVDLPTGGLVQGFHGIPTWNELTHDHVKFSLVVASTVMDDMGWALVICPSTALSLNGHTQKMNVFYALAFHKVGINPSFDHESAQKVGRVLQQDLSMEIMIHYLPSSARTTRNGKSGGWRGMLERSVAHMLLYVEALCSKIGTCLEFGGGTWSLVKAAMHTFHGCLVMESDLEICEGYLSPFVQEYYGALQVAELGDNDDSIDDVGNDLVVNDVPSDYELPCYVEAMARHMATTYSYDQSLVCKRRRRSCIFIDNHTDLE
ncbi:hypothetical protein GOP47_0025518 [Adiantum capillus-veneris]|uniref:Uncharacterized protein n=1 Tax=Adiantum capillus-veneris TaxID=13818 RepID=A0A9D4Z319_ADICA|nr:hypothetical protein GOP47_0025518 [Adiantum capillus-veneris]